MGKTFYDSLNGSHDFHFLNAYLKLAEAFFMVKISIKGIHKKSSDDCYLRRGVHPLSQCLKLWPLALAPLLEVHPPSPAQLSP